MILMLCGHIFSELKKDEKMYVFQSLFHYFISFYAMLKNILLT